MPPSESSLKPHIRFQKEDIERPRYKPPRPIRRPERDNARHGAALGTSVTLLQKSFEHAVERTPPEFNPAFIFRLRLDGYVDEDEWRRSGLTVLSVEPDGAVVLFSEDQLTEFQRRVQEYGRRIPEDRRSPTYAWLATVTEDMRLWEREDRIGRKLAGQEIQPNKQYRLDVELWSYGSEADRQIRMAELREFVVHGSGQFLDAFIGASLSIARVGISGEMLEQLLLVGIVKTVDIPPEPHLTIGQLLSTGLDDFPHPVEPPPEDAPGICIVDSGINRGHPFLGPAVGYTLPIPRRSGDGLDAHGHGTMVAGVALYGNVQECIEGLRFNPEFTLYGARVTNADNRFDDESLIVNQMREAVETFHREYGCRVFNVSLGDADLVYGDGKPSPWAYILDTLARDLDVVVVVSAGNLPVLGMHGERANRLRDEYPRYLLGAESRIIEPATAAIALTVGALAHSESSFQAGRHPNDPAIRGVAGIDQPSPFTRCGPGVNGAIKPEVCEYGGNVTWDGRGGGRILDRDPGVSIISTSGRHLERLFATDIGTSLAAPKIAHLAASILKRYPGISANLVRVLIANAASVPDALENTFNDEDQILKTCGYGRPDKDRALFSSDHRVTLVAEDIIPLDRIHLYEIPVPDAFQQAKGKRRITVSLAFDPPVRHTRRDYLGVKMDFRLLRGLTSDAIVNWYAERQADADPDEIPERYHCSMSPSPNRRGGGTLQKATFVATLNRAFTDYGRDTFHLLLRCQSVWASSLEFPSQRYALCVTLEHLQEPIELYNLVEQQIALPQRVRIRTRS